MPRSDPNSTSPNPAKRFFLWDGAKGDIKYWNKEAEAEERIELPFEFILLDRLAVIKGWHDASESGIWSNEVRRTNEEELTVRAFKLKEIIAQGLYSDIKDKIKAAGGRFNINLYIAFTDMDGADEHGITEIGEGNYQRAPLVIGALTMHGAPMSAWIEQEREHRKELFQKGIIISGFEEGKKGGVKFRVPKFELAEIPAELDDQAGELQKALQKYLTKYLARKTEVEGDYSGEDMTPEEIATMEKINKDAQLASEDDGEIPY